MAKWLLFAGTILLSRYPVLLRAPAVSAIDYAAVTAKKIVLAFITSMIAACFFAAGIVITIYAWFTQFEATGSFVPSGPVIGGIVLAASGVGLFVFAYRSEFWSGSKAAPRSPLEELAVNYLNSSFFKTAR